MAARYHQNRRVHRPRAAEAAREWAGYLLADAYERARELIGPVGTIVFVVFAATLVFRHLRRRRLTVA